MVIGVDISLFLNCASAVIDITVKVAHLLYMDSGSMDYGLLHVLCHQHRPGTGLPVVLGLWTQTGPSNAAGIMDINMDSGHSTDHGHPLGLL